MEYKIYYENSFNNLPMAFKESNIIKNKICIISDNNVSALYSKHLISILENLFKDIYLFEFKSGEKSKNLNTIQDMYDFFIEKRLDRKSVVIALGGGVVGDMAGFAAATYMRGIKFVQIPTSVLAQVDSSVGGKVGIDYRGNKNIIGAFYNPSFVYINVNTIKTLPKREFSAGVAEAIKYGMIISKDYYEYIKQNKYKILNVDEDILKTMIQYSCKFKYDIVLKDEKESGLREILNFGHTFGHAIETIMDFKFVHGECVALGMICAMYICRTRHIISNQEFEEFKDLLLYFNLPTNIADINSDEVYDQMFLDKKVKDNSLSFVLINKIGEAFRTKEINKNEILEAIEYIRK